jgi:hypothetical protein
VIGMVAYEFYWRDSTKGFELIGILPERRKDPKRISQASIMNWGKMILGEYVDENDIFFIKVTIDKTSGDILRFKNY